MQRHDAYPAETPRVRTLPRLCAAHFDAEGPSPTSPDVPDLSTPRRKAILMKILVAYATRHGATAGIATRIAETLTTSGHDCTASPVEDVADITPYEAVVLGGAAYMFHWLKPATAFARRHRDELITKPVWLFSSGPLGPDEVDAEGHDPRETTRPKEWDELTSSLHPRGEQVFFGAYDTTTPAIGVRERVFRRLPAASTMLPEGDFRNWPEIESWARHIAQALAFPAGDQPKEARA